MSHLKQLKVILAGMLMLSALTACISPSTSPSYVQSGDFVSVNLGGIKRNLGGQLLKRLEITATIKDANNTVYRLRDHCIYLFIPTTPVFTPPSSRWRRTLPIPAVCIPTMVPCMYRFS